MSIFRKLFYLNAWAIGYREITKDVSLPSKKNKGQYSVIKLNDHMYYADPFVFEDNEKTYLFAESMNRYRGKATISVSEYSNGQFGKFKEVLRENFHLSYPNVFKWNNRYYMIPESSDCRQIRLYVAENFPYEWQLCSVLKDDGNLYTDNSIEIIDNHIFFITFYEKNSERYSEYYELDLEKLKLLKPNLGDVFQNLRPAGNPFLSNGMLVRPLQDCKEYYGKAVLIYSHEVGKTETKLSRIDCDCYSFDRNIRNMTGTHTLNRSEHF